MITCILLRTLGGKGGRGGRGVKCFPKVGDFGVPRTYCAGKQTATAKSGDTGKNGDPGSSKN